MFIVHYWINFIEFFQNPQPQYYEDTYYTRATNDGRVTVKHVNPPGAPGAPAAPGAPGAPGAPAAPVAGFPLGAKLERHARYVHNDFKKGPNWATWYPNAELPPNW